MFVYRPGGGHTVWNNAQGAQAASAHVGDDCVPVASVAPRQG